MLVPPKRSSAVLVMISSMSASICATVLTLDELIVVNCDFLGGHPSLMLSFDGSLLTQRHETCAHDTSGSRLAYGEKPEKDYFCSHSHPFP